MEGIAVGQTFTEVFYLGNADKGRRRTPQRFKISQSDRKGEVRPFGLTAYIFTFSFNIFRRKKLKKIDKIRIIPLGGLNEIGKNLTLLECGKDIIAVDCGLAFPDEEMPGVDYVIPDTQYIIKNADRFIWAEIILLSIENHSVYVLF